MTIVAIGWLYVIVLMSCSETSFAAGVATFLFYGLLPLALLLWFGGSRQRRRLLADQESCQRDRSDAGGDQ